MRTSRQIFTLVALLAWSATFVVGCKKKTAVDEGPAVRLTMTSENLTMTNYKDGKMSYRFTTPYLQRFEGKGHMGQDTVFMLFERGIDVVTFADSTDKVDTHIVAKWAIFHESEELWEARDSVVGRGADGKTLYTDLLYWDQKAGRIHSPIRTKVIDGDETIIGVNGFESDDKMENIEFVNTQGRFLVDTLANKN